MELVFPKFPFYAYQKTSYTAYQKKALLKNVSVAIS